MPPSSQPGASTCISRIRSMHHTFLMRLSKQQPNTSIYILMQCPTRCLYSRNIENLFMAGRNISVTHVALGTVRVMRTTGMMGEVVGMAASLCKKVQHHSERSISENTYRN